MYVEEFGTGLTNESEKMSPHKSKRKVYFIIKTSFRSPKRKPSTPTSKKKSSVLKMPALAHKLWDLFAIKGTFACP